MDGMNGWHQESEISRDAVMGIVFSVVLLSRAGEQAFGCLVDGQLQGIYASEREAQTRMEMTLLAKRMEQVAGMDCMV